MRAQSTNIQSTNKDRDYQKHRTQTHNGYAALTATLLTVVVSLTVIGGLTFFSLREINVTRTFIRSIESRYTSEGGIEDALYRVLTQKQLVSGEELAVGKGTTTVIVTQQGNQRIIRSEGKRDRFQQNLETRLDVSVAGTNFLYGAQIGDGGLDMKNNSRVTGSVYSNGSITGSAGATITGDAYVAVGSPSAINQSWTVQNSDVSVGTRTGSIISIIDNSGTVDGYTSLALGSDNFARISYIGGSKDLRMGRCSNDNCTSPVLTTVDTLNDIDEVTSLAIASDGFARITYYRDTADDLGFARCINNNCTTPVITLVETENNVGDFSSIKMGSDGYPRIAYWYDTSSDVRFARCLNIDCTLRNIRNVDTSGNVGEYIALVLGSDGLGRMSYYDDSNKDLKFARCQDQDCSTFIRTTVDSTGSVGKFTSLVLGSDGFARISYFDESNGDLKLARCLNTDCTLRNLTTVDSTGTVGQHTSIALGGDGFPRISYYDSSNGDLKFARCLNLDCASAEISRVDNASSVGLYNSLGIAPDGFGRISYWAQTDRHLRYVRCIDAKCSPPLSQADVAQSFQPSATARIVRVDMLLKKVGNPQNATLRIITNSGSRPSSSPSNVLATGILTASSVGSSYAWVSVWLTATPTLNANTTYWVVLDSSEDSSNYYVWGGDTNAGYTRGNALASADWQSAAWTALTEDLNFRVWMGGVDNELRQVTVNGNAAAHIIDNSTVGGNADGFIVRNNSTITGNVNANSLSNCIVNGNAAFNSQENCVILGSQTTPTTPPADLAKIPLPIATSTIDGWKNDAASGGTCVQPQCDGSGDFKITNGQTASLGPKKITGKLEVDNLATLTVTGTIWVVGDIILSNNCNVRLSSGYGDMSGVIITDGKLVISNNCIFAGSGNPQSFIMVLSDKNSLGEEIMTIDNNSVGVVYYAGRGWIKFSNGAQAKQATAYGIRLDNNANLIYDAGLANTRFSAGPAGGYDVKTWREVE